MTVDEFQIPSLTDTAYLAIRDSIVLGKLRPGHKLVVNDLVDEWRISNTPIKEALNRLVAENLIEAQPRRGMRVRVYSAKEVREIFEIRALYEIHCCRLAVHKVKTDRDALEQLTATQKKSQEIFAGTANHMKLFALDEQFHLQIVQLCGNDTLIKDFNRLHANALAIGIHANKHDPLRRRAESNAEHDRVLQGLIDGSEGKVAEAMRVHLENTAKDLLEFYTDTL